MIHAQREVDGDGVLREGITLARECLRRPVSPLQVARPPELALRRLGLLEGLQLPEVRQQHPSLGRSSRYVSSPALLCRPGSGLLRRVSG
eukprot:COSAG06_NODE_3822_length_4873_cov_1.814202_2_plen_90_part_00